MIKPILIIVSSVTIAILISFAAYYALTDMKFLAIFAMVSLMLIVVLKVLNVIKELIA
mgnify:CR=1 FL=1